MPVTLSIGVSDLDSANPTTEHMFDTADFALYQVKRNGRDGVAVRECGAPVPADHPESEKAGTPVQAGTPVPACPPPPEPGRR